MAAHCGAWAQSQAFCAPQAASPPRQLYQDFLIVEGARMIAFGPLGSFSYLLLTIDRLVHWQLTSVDELLFSPGLTVSISNAEVLGQPEEEAELSGEMLGDLEKEDPGGAHPGE